MKQLRETPVVPLRKQSFARFTKMKRSNHFTWNSRTVSTKTPRLSPKWDDRCFAYCFILRRLIFSVYHDMVHIMNCRWAEICRTPRNQNNVLHEHLPMSFRSSLPKFMMANFNLDLLSLDRVQKMSNYGPLAHRLFREPGAKVLFLKGAGCMSRGSSGIFCPIIF